MPMLVTGIGCYEEHGELVKLANQELKAPFSDTHKLEEFVNRNSWNCRIDHLRKVLGGK